jgi:hypothetical protein
VDVGVGIKDSEIIEGYFSEVKHIVKVICVKQRRQRRAEYYQMPIVTSTYFQSV